MPSNDSFINANLMSAHVLAKLLTSLSNNEKEYNKFMRFKKDPIPKHFEDIALMSYTHPNAACRICAYADNMRIRNDKNNDDKINADKFIDRAKPPKNYDNNGNYNSANNNDNIISSSKQQKTSNFVI